MTVKISLPCVMTFDDYHHIDDFVDKLNEITKEKIKGKEIGFDGQNYVGIIYTERQPTKSEIDDILSKNNIKLI